jgi:hypothetical protein
LVPTVATSLLTYVIATLGAVDLFGHVTDIGEAFSVEL